MHFLLGTFPFITVLPHLTFFFLRGYWIPCSYNHPFFILHWKYTCKLYYLGWVAYDLRCMFTFCHFPLVFGVTSFFFLAGYCSNVSDLRDIGCANEGVIYYGYVYVHEVQHPLLWRDCFAWLGYYRRTLQKEGK